MSYLQEIIDKHNGMKTVQVAFFDVVSYSKRVSRIQKAVIDNFTDVLTKSLKNVAGQNVEFFSKNELNYTTDFIKIATGDGAMVVIPLDGQSEIALRICEEVLIESNRRNKENDCNIFREKKWCNCHSNFSVRAAASEGRGIIYKDLNNAFNVAGTAFNLAARILSFADGEQILLSASAYESIINFSNNVSVADDFVEYSNLPAKNMGDITVYQYVKPNVEWLNRNRPVPIEMLQTMSALSLTQAGLPDINHMVATESKDMLSKVSKMAVLMKDFEDLKNSFEPNEASTSLKKNENTL